MQRTRDFHIWVWNCHRIINSAKYMTALICISMVRSLKDGPVHNVNNQRERLKNWIFLDCLQCLWFIWRGMLASHSDFLQFQTSISSITCLQSLPRFYASLDTPNTYHKKPNYVHFDINDFQIKGYITNSLKQQRMLNSYNLFAVSNHYGTMNRGHYTAFCKNAKSNAYVFNHEILHLESLVVTTNCFLFFHFQMV